MWAAARRQEKMWSVKALVEQVLQHGRRALEITRTNHNKLNKWPCDRGVGVGGGAGKSAVISTTGEVGQGIRTAVGTAVAERGAVNHLPTVSTRLIQSFVRKVSQPLWSEARRRATKRLVYGESAPFFALVGVTLVSGSQQGLVTKEDELEALCCDIREAITRAGLLLDPEFWVNQKLSNGEGKRSTSVKTFDEINEEISHAYSFNDLELGPYIDKGCNAVIYAARWNEDDWVTQDTSPPPEKRRKSFPSTAKEELQVDSYYDGAVAVDYFDITSAIQQAHLLEATSGSAPKSVVTPSAVGTEAFTTALHSNQNQAKKIDGQERQGRILNQEKDNEHSKTSDEYGDDPIKSQYPLAVKMMFNYEAESNAPAILRAMYKEMIPATDIQLDEVPHVWQQWFLYEHLRLPAHPNIVEMPCVFVDRIPLLKDSMRLYPDALPQRLNPYGSGRNMSLFCVMRRYDMSLQEYLQRHKPSLRSSIILFTQLMEAVLHIHQYNIVHRDMKTDNILLNIEEGWSHPQLVLTDFGCCLAQDGQSMSVPFPSREADPRQGNAQHMSPEVKGAVPGLLRYVSFAASDLWACGVLAYEIFGAENPFATSEGTSKRGKNKVLDSVSYKESQLPRLPKDVPVVIKHLVHDLLRRNPKNRPSPTVAATLCHLVLWGPSKWLNRHSLTLPSPNEIMQWLLCLTTKVLCEAGISRQPIEDISGDGLRRRSVRWGGRRGGAVISRQQLSHGRASNSQREGGQLEYELVSTFLARVHFTDIVQAIKWNRAF